MRLRADSELILAGVEAVYGTAEALVGTDAVQCDIDITPMESTPKERNFTRPHFGSNSVIHTEKHRAVKLSNIELAGSGTASIAPAWATIFRGCGWAADVQPAGTTFNPVTENHESLTLDPSIDGELFRLIGARGSLSMLFQIGEFPTFEANFKGGWVDPETLGAVPTGNWDDWKIPLPVNCTNSDALTIHGESYPFYELSIDQGSTIDFYCVPGETGSRIEIMNRKVKGKVKLQAKQISEHDLFALVNTDALDALQLIHGDTAGSILETGGPKVQITNPRKSDYKGDLAWECDLIFTADTGDDEVYLIAR